MAVHAVRTSSLDLPRPGRTAVPLLVLALLALLLEIDPRLPWLAGLAGGVCFGAAAAFRSLQAHRELAAVRRTADRLIVHSPGTLDASSELIRWRSEELTAWEPRARLARELERLIRQLDERRLPSSSPLRRGAARRQLRLLEALDARLREGRPVTARGMLLARDVLRNPGSPLYADAADVLLARTLVRVLGALEP